MTRSRLSLAPLALSVLAVACAHGPASRVGFDALAPDHRAAAPDGARAPERVFVTGSRLPAYVDPRTGRPVTTSPVQIFTREELFRTGVPTNLDAALYRLEPTFR